MSFKNYLWFGFAAACAILPTGCQNKQSEDASGLSVAGGSVDLKGEFNSSVYVKVHPLRSDGGEIDQMEPITSVATILDAGLPGYTVMILSLADSYTNHLIAGQNMMVLPSLVNVSLSIYPENRAAAPVRVEKLSFNERGVLSNGAKLVVVGAKLLATGAEIPARLRAYDVQGAVNKLNDKIFVPNSSLQFKDVDYRNYLTSFLMIAVPHAVLKGDAAQIAAIKSIKGAALVGVGEASKLTMVGFGGTHQNASETKRNYAPVTMAAGTGLGATLAGSSFYGRELFEVTGSGLCGQGATSDERSFDTGASIIDANGNLVGIAVKSESRMNGSLGYDCQSERLEDVTTLVVAPTQAQIQHLLSR